jgi:ABC-2 type transport system permease protein
MTLNALAPAWLIAGREFRAYVATTSFWVALLIAPLLMAGGLLFGVAAKPAAQAVAVYVASDDASISAGAFAALAAAGELEGRRFSRSPDSKAAAVLSVRRTGAGDLALRLEGGMKLSRAGRALMARTIERDDAARRLGEAGRPGPIQASVASAPPAPPRDPQSTPRLLLVLMLWLTLTGSLGMLLQAVVRERANRSLECLLAAARPWQIVFGKLAGVGGVSLLVLISWLASSAALTSLGAASNLAAAGPLMALADPGLLVGAGLAYLLGFLFFGLTTIAIGARAADSADAQNRARPMFSLLLIVFFAALAVANSAGGLNWLVYAPPFTPFLLILENRSMATTSAALLLLFLGTGLAGFLAVRSLSLAPPQLWNLKKIRLPHS